MVVQVKEWNDFNILRVHGRRARQIKFTNELSKRNKLNTEKDQIITPVCVMRRTNWFWPNSVLDATASLTASTTVILLSERQHCIQEIQKDWILKNKSMISLIRTGQMDTTFTGTVTQSWQTEKHNNTVILQNQQIPQNICWKIAKAGATSSTEWDSSYSHVTHVPIQNYFVVSCKNKNYWEKKC